MKIPSVLVFTITYSGKDYVWEEFSKAAKSLSYPNFRHLLIDNTDDNGEYADKLRGDGFEVIKLPRGNNSREAITRGQEYARRLAVKEGYDYIMSLESDLIVIPHVIQSLIGNAKEYIGCLYYIGPEHRRMPCITVPEKHEKYNLMGSRLLRQEEYDDYYMKGLFTVNNCGLGCTLIERRVFEKIAFMYLPDLKTHSDAYYANAAWNNGFRVYVDTDIVLRHKNVDWNTVKDR